MRRLIAAAFLALFAATAVTVPAHASNAPQMRDTNWPCHAC